MHSAPKVHVNKDLKGADLHKFFNIDSMQSYGKNGIYLAKKHQTVGKMTFRLFAS